MAKQKQKQKHAAAKKGATNNKKERVRNDADHFNSPEL